MVVWIRKCTLSCSRSVLLRAASMNDLGMSNPRFCIETFVTSASKINPNYLKLLFTNYLDLFPLAPHLQKFSAINFIPKRSDVTYSQSSFPQDLPKSVRHVLAFFAFLFIIDLFFSHPYWYQPYDITRNVFRLEKLILNSCAFPLGVTKKCYFIKGRLKDCFYVIVNLLRNLYIDIKSQIRPWDLFLASCWKVCSISVI